MLFLDESLNQWGEQTGRADENTHDNTVIVPILVPPNFLAFTKAGAAQIKVVANRDLFAFTLEIGAPFGLRGDLSTSYAYSVRYIGGTGIAGVSDTGICSR